MITDQVRKQLEEMRSNAYGEALKIYLADEIEKMKDIKTIKTIKELQARQEAEKILTNLFKFIDYKPGNNFKTKYN